MWLLTILSLGNFLPVTTATAACPNNTRYNAMHQVLGVYVPQCEGNGLYSAEQCHQSVSQCWCVTESGEEIPDTRLFLDPSWDTSIFTHADPDAPKRDCRKERAEFGSRGPKGTLRNGTTPDAVRDVGRENTGPERTLSRSVRQANQTDSNTTDSNSTTAAGSAANTTVASTSTETTTATTTENGTTTASGANHTETTTESPNSSPPNTTVSDGSTATSASTLATSGTNATPTISITAAQSTTSQPIDRLLSTLGPLGNMSLPPQVVEEIVPLVNRLTKIVDELSQLLNNQSTTATPNPSTSTASSSQNESTTTESPNATTPMTNASATQAPEATTASSNTTKEPDTGAHDGNATAVSNAPTENQTNQATNGTTEMPTGPQNNTKAVTAPTVSADNETCGDNTVYSLCASQCPAGCDSQEEQSCPSSNCTPGCVCTAGYIRLRANDTHSPCVRQSSCADQAVVKPPHAQRCQDPNSAWSTCGSPCEETCQFRPSSCPRQCAAGCFCKNGYVKETSKASALCIPKSLCVQAPQPYQQQCQDPNAVLSNCGSACEETCDSRPKTCALPCTTGCFCKNGFVKESKSANARCVPRGQCKQAGLYQRRATANQRQAFQGRTAPECPDPNASWSDCGTSCPEACRLRKRYCSTTCVAGCFCNEGFVKEHRTSNAKCVPRTSCPVA